MGLKAKFVAAVKALFGDSARAFGTVSVIFLVSLAIAPAKNHFSEWRHYQKGYLGLIAHRADARTLERRAPSGVQQIWNPQLGVVDRCQTCHTAMQESTLKDVSMQPYRPHPPIPHKLDEFGCVVCHRGQGPATTVAEAHRSTSAWEEPLLPARYLEASCGQCHLQNLSGTPRLNEGRKLLASFGCVRCHTVRQGDGTVMRGKDNPPSLEHIADKTTREWIFAWIKDPQAYAVSATMPNFGFSDDDARDITAFLVSQSTPLNTDTAPVPVAANAADPAAGASVYGESFCASCHAVQTPAGDLVGGNTGPELTNVGSKVKPQWLAAWLRNPAAYDPDTLMPHYRFSDAQVALLTSFLGAKTNSDLLANVHLSDATPQQISHGKLLVSEYGCASCHVINGVKRPDNFAPELTRIGSKSLSLLAFPESVPHSLPDYLAAKIRDPRAFGASLKMPKFTLTPAQVDALTTALLAQTDRAQDEPPQLRQAAVPESNYQPAGAAGKLMTDLRCFSCHRINGHGGEMAPDLTWEGSSVQRPWLVAFLKNPNTLRPALIRRMPRFNLSDAEIQALTDYIMTAYQTAAFDAESLPAASFTPAEVESGRQLFYSKFQCQSCHIVDPKKDKGYIGPTLSQVGSRLTSAWMFHWLKDPQSLRPGTIEPNQHISDSDARALAAYLSSLKSTRVQEAKK